MRELGETEKDVPLTVKKLVQSILQPNFKKSVVFPLLLGCVYSTVTSEVLSSYA